MTHRKEEEKFDSPFSTTMFEQHVRSSSINQIPIYKRTIHDSRTRFHPLIHLRFGRFSHRCQLL